MKKPAFILVCISFLIIGCSPKVMTEVIKSYPATRAVDVQVVQVGDSVPGQAEKLGTTAIGQRSFDDAVVLAKVETAKVGGNVFAIRDEAAGTGFSNRLQGDMFRLQGTRREVEQALADAGKLVIAPTAEPVKRPKRNFRNGFTSAYVTAGGGFITSKVEDISGGGIWGRPKNGREIQGGIDWVGHKGVGMGLLVSWYRSGTYGSRRDDLKDYRLHMNFYYIAPELVVKHFFADSWAAKLGVGLGVFLGREKVEKNSRMNYDMNGFGQHTQLGLEYMLLDHLGIGINGGYILGFIPERDYFTERGLWDDESNEYYELDRKTRRKEINGYVHWFINGGIRIYF